LALRVSNQGGDPVTDQQHAILGGRRRHLRKGWMSTSAAGEGAEGALEAEVAELEERWCELTERIGCRRIG
jgi:hypothetical protein